MGSLTPTVRESEMSLLTYRTLPRTCLPPLLDADNVYPFSIYPYTLSLANHSHPKDRIYRTVEVENEYLKVTVLPDLGGRIFQIEDSQTGAAYLHDNRCVRPVRIPPRWNFLSLGIELNFPYTHSPTGTEPVGYELIRDVDVGMAGVAVGEQERQWGLSWRAEVRLYRGYRGVVVAVRCWNDTRVSRRVQWWSNAAQPCGGDTEFVFPDEPIIAHVESEEDGTWPFFNDIDLRRHRNFDRMIGTFHHPSTADWFGVYHHERRWGLLHLADPARLPGKKLWSFGHTGATADWTLAMTRDGGTSCEIQSGVPALQSEHLDLAPGADFAFAEIWQPVDDRSELEDEIRTTFGFISKQLGGIHDAPRRLPPMDHRVPGILWRQLLQVWQADDKSRLAALEVQLGDENTGWPPSGYPDLAQALDWAETHRSSCPLWAFMRGIHAGALEDWDTAESRLRHVAELSREPSGWHRPGAPRAMACALRARLLIQVRNRQEEGLLLLTDAAKELCDGSMLEEVDTLLHDMNRTADRRDLLAWWPEHDLRRYEVEASIEIDCGNPAKGLRILMSTPWERHHCRHRRTHLWCEARTRLQKPTDPVPSELMEDPYVVSG